MNLNAKRLPLGAVCVDLLRVQTDAEADAEVVYVQLLLSRVSSL